MKLALAFISLLFLLFGEDKRQQEYRISGYAQGTTYAITYFASENRVTKRDVDSLVKVIDASMSLYQANSAINRFNESARGTTVDYHFLKVYRRALDIFRDTRGVFDVTVAPLVQAWGFGPKKVVNFPDDQVLGSLLKCVGMKKVKLSGNFLEKEIPCVHIDFNGIAQGYTVDLIARYLQHHKIASFMVEVGGELRINGSKPDGQLFKVGIEGPINKELSDNRIKHILQIKQGAITTSGNYQKYLMNGNQRISHLIDPKTGYPLNNEMISVTVFAKDAITADGYDNALMAMGVKKALDFVRKKRNMEVYIIYKKQNGELADTLSAGFKRFIIN